MLVISKKNSFIIRAEQDLKILNQVIDLPVNSYAPYILAGKMFIERVFVALGVWGLPFKLTLSTLLFLYYLVRLFKCDTLIITSDRDRDFVFISAMKAAKYNNLLIQLWILSDESEGEKIREQSRRYWVNWIDEIFESFHGANLIRNGVRALKFYTISDLALLRLFGLFSLNPWRLGYGYSHEIYVFNMAQYDNIKNRFFDKPLYYREFPIKKHSNQDLDVIFAIPQLYEHGFVPLQENRTLIDSVLSIFQQYALTVGISLHPKMKYGTYKDIIEKYPHFYIENLQNEILRGKNFICINSTTSYWAANNDIPVIMLNFHGLNVSNFIGIQNITIVNDLDSLVANIEKISKGKAQHEKN